MLKLTSKLLALSLLVTMTLLGIVVVSPHNTDHYLAAARDKYRLLYSRKSPKIILVGGSNGAFSINSEKIESYFNVPVVNMALHAGVGLRFMINEIKPALGNGDIVIISPEYSHLNGDLEGSPEALGDVIKFCPECISGLNTPSDIFIATKGILQLSESDILRFVKDSGNEVNGILDRQNFNQWGDFIGHLDQPDKRNPNDFFPEIKVLPDNPSIRFLNSFYQSRQPANAQIFFMFPAIPLDDYLAQEENFITVYNVLSDELQIPILGTPKDFTFPDEYFYDTGYHMNGIGREKRTDAIIAFLSSALKK